jgi:predicted nucleic acid-binding protein
VISVVIDASVAMKWLPLFASETFAAEASALLDRNRRSEINFLVPDLFWPEVGNVLGKAVRRQACNLDEAQIALATLQEQSLLIISAADLMKSALDIAVRYGRSVYDCVYVALAVTSHCQLVTADEKLANALAAHLPVKWLGAI